MLRVEGLSVKYTARNILPSLTSRKPSSSRKLRRYVMIFARVMNFCLTESFRIKSKYR